MQNVLIVWFCCEVLREASINYETNLLQSSNNGPAGDSPQMTSLVNCPANQMPASTSPSTPVIDTNCEA